MSAVTVLSGDYPTAAPGSLSANAVLLSSLKGEALIDIAGVQGQLNFELLRWNSAASSWYPVRTLESQLRPDPANLVPGKNRFTFDIEGPAYYLLWTKSSLAAYIDSAYLEEIYSVPGPQAGSVPTGVRASKPDYTAPVAASATAVHAAVAATAANIFAAPFGSIEAWGRNLTVTFGAGWDGGNVTVTGTDQFGQVISETFLSNAGGSRTGSKTFRTVTGAVKTAIGASSDGASIGIGAKLGVPFAFTAGQNFTDSVGEAATLDTTNYNFAPSSVPNASRNYKFLGWL